MQNTLSTNIVNPIEKKMFLLILEHIHSIRPNL